jgi:hypothetical protein
VSPAELEALLLGLLRLWQVEGSVRTAREGEAVTAAIDVDGAAQLTVIWQHAPFGIAWQVQAADERLRTYPSIISLIRDLRGRLALERDAARVLFVKGGG